MITSINNEEALSKEIYNHSSIIIYGAGMIANLLTKRLISSRLWNKVICYAVSNNDGNNSKYLNHLPVYEIVKIGQQAYESLIIVATLENTHPSIKESLDRQGITNVLYINEGLYRDMRNKEITDMKRKSSYKLRVSEMSSFLDETDTSIIGLGEEDGILNTMIDNNVSYKEVRSADFFYDSEGIPNSGTIFCTSFPSEIPIDEFYKKLFRSTNKIIISYRRYYIDLNGFNLFHKAHQSGFILTGAKTFFRSPNEYNADDLLLCFKKAEPALLAHDILCTGCGACANLCPMGALSMEADAQGYFRPYLEQSKCNSCGKCLRVCPVKKSNNRTTKSNPECYAAMASDDIRCVSSSGGMFTLLANKSIDNSGVVCGVAWNSDFGVEHIFVDEKRDLHKLQKSKYAQSDMKDSFYKIKELLCKGIMVLFTGCPCQVAGLYSYLGKDYDNLYTIDFICTQAPSQSIFKNYLKENFDVSKIKQYDFRRKEYGWRHSTVCVTLKSGETIFYTDKDDPLQASYHPRLTMPVHCEYCSFAGFPRQGDLTIADFWQIKVYDATLDDDKGTSTVLINSRKGNSLFESVGKELKLCKKVPLEWLKHNRIYYSFYAHYGRDRFYDLLEKTPFNRAVELAIKNEYDIGLVGNWSYPNYGSELTNFALYSVLINMGYSVLLIEWPECSEWKPYGSTQLFQTEPYANTDIAPIYPTRGDMAKLNEKCDIFVQGSDQLLHNYLYEVFDKTISLDWVYSYKKKIGYALSFGQDEFYGTAIEQAEMSNLLKRYDYISARESSGVRVLEQKFGVKAQQVLDPVFLCNIEEYRTLIKRNRNILPSVSYLYTYILDPNPIKGRALLQAAEKLNLEAKAILDGESKDRIKQSFWQLDTIYNASIETWLAYISNCDFCITDSFHGVCFAIIFKKDFIAIINDRRGATRFESLMSLLKLDNRMIKDLDGIIDNPELFNPINYDDVYEILDIEKSKSLQWLDSALKTPKGDIEMSDFDVLQDRYNRLENMIMELYERLI